MTLRRASAALALCAVSLGAGGPGGAADAAPAPADSAYHGGRRAIIEVGLPPRAPTALDSIPHPWPGRALVLSAAGTAMPIVLATLPSDAHRETRRDLAIAMFAAEIVTPATGYLYGGIGRQAIGGMLVRGLGFAVFMGGASELYVGGSDGGWGPFLALGGGGLMALSAIWDTAMVTTRVERANQDLLRRRFGIGVLPPGRDEPARLVVGVRF